MIKYANFVLSRRLYTALGRPNFKVSEVSNLYAVGKRGRCLGLTTDGYNPTDWSNFIPAYSFDELYDMAIKAGHNPIKFKKEGKKTILTSPPCNHIEASSIENALAKLLLRSLGRSATA